MHYTQANGLVHRGATEGKRGPEMTFNCDTCLKWEIGDKYE